MSSSYTITEYLLDRANIHDVVTKLMIYFDTRQYHLLPSEVFAPEVLYDYTSLFGGEPRTVKPQEITEQWEGIAGTMSATQHATCSVLITLPQPGEGVTKPNTAGVVSNCLVQLVKKGVDPSEGREGSGGRYDIELTRTNETVGGPWRISHLKAVAIWQEGNTKVMKYKDLNE